MLLLHIAVEHEDREKEETERGDPVDNGICPVQVAGCSPADIAPIKSVANEALLFAERGDGQNEEDRDGEEVRVADNSVNGAIVSQATKKAECQFHEAEQGEIICDGGEKIADGEYAGGGLVQRTRLVVELFYDDIYDRGGFNEDDEAGQQNEMSAMYWCNPFSCGVSHTQRREEWRI